MPRCMFQMKRGPAGTACLWLTQPQAAMQYSNLLHFSDIVLMWMSLRAPLKRWVHLLWKWTHMRAQQPMPGRC